MAQCLCCRPMPEAAVAEADDDAHSLMEGSEDQQTINSLRARKTKSAALLKREQDAQGKLAPRNFLAKVRDAVTTSSFCY